MSSLAAKIVDRGFRLVMLRKFSQAQDFVKHGRALMHFVRPPAQLPSGVTIQKTTLDEHNSSSGIPAMCVTTVAPQSTVLYIHGGAFVCGMFHTYMAICGQLAKHLNARVYWIDYRMAPEFPFPAATDDAFAAYQALTRRYPDEAIAIIGDSAGGNLTLSTTLRIRDELAKPGHDPLLRLPSCSVAMSALTDFSSSPPSREASNKSDCALSSQIVDFAAEAYLNGHDPTDPYVSPLCGDLSGLPPIFLTASDAEIVRDDSHRFANKARRAGVSVRLLTRWDAPHAWPVLFSLMPEARADVAEIIGFMRQQLVAQARTLNTQSPAMQACAS